MRLIDADKLLAELNDLEPRCANKFIKQGIDDGLHYYMPKILEEQPTIDAVPVVRCKDCKHWKKGGFMGGDTPDSLEYGGGCPLVRFARYESDFCGKGERKDGGGDG